MSEQDLIGINRVGMMRPEMPRVKPEMESPVVGLSEDTGMPDRFVFDNGVAEDTPGVRMALRNEARAKAFLGVGESSGPARSLIG